MRPLVRSRHDTDRQHRTPSEPAVCSVAADFRPRIPPVSLAGRDRRHAPPAEHAPGRRPRARRRTRCRHRAEHRALSRRHRRARCSPSPNRRCAEDSRVALQRYARVARIVDFAPRKSAYHWPMRPWRSSSRRSSFAPSTTPNARSRVSHACSARMGSRCSSNTCASSRFLAACQDNLLQPWRRFAGGCRCNRPTAELMRACGFAVAADDVVWRGMPPIVRPLMVGLATR